MTALLLAAAFQTELPPHFPEGIADRIAALDDAGVEALATELALDYGSCPYPAVLARLLELSSPEALRYVENSPFPRALLPNVLAAIPRLIEADAYASDKRIFEHLRESIRPGDEVLLRESLLNAGVTRARLLGLRLLGFLATADARALLAERLGADNTAERVEAIRGLAESGDAGPLPPLLTDLYAGVRHEAAVALHRLGDPRGAEALRAAIRSSHPEALDAAAYAAESAPELLDGAPALLALAREEMEAKGPRKRSAAVLMALQGTEADRERARDAVERDHELYDLRLMVKYDAPPPSLEYTLKHSDELSLRFATHSISPEEAERLVDQVVSLASNAELRDAAMLYLSGLLEEHPVPSRRAALIALAREHLDDPYDTAFDAAGLPAAALKDEVLARLVAAGLDRRPTYAVYEALKALQPPEAIPTLLKHTRDEDPDIQREAVKLLVEYGHPDAGDRALDFLERHGRQWSLEGLSRVARPEHHDRIVELVRAAEKPWQVETLLEMLLPISVADDAAMLLEFLDHEERDVVSLAIDGLVRLKDRRLLERIRAGIAGGGGQQVRCIEGILGPDGADDYRRLLLHADASVRRAAAEACGTHGVEAAAPLLEKIVRTDLGVGGHALDALAKIRGAGVLPLAREMCDDGLYENRCWPLLARFGGDGDVPRLLEAARRRSDWWTRRVALHSLNALVHRDVYARHEGDLRLAGAFDSTDALFAAVKRELGIELRLSASAAVPLTAKHDEAAGDGLAEFLRELCGARYWPRVEPVPLCREGVIELVTFEEAAEFWEGWKP